MSLLLRFTPKELKQAFAKYRDLHMCFSKEAMLRKKVINLSLYPTFSCLPTGLRFMIAKRSWSSHHDARKIIKKSHVHMEHTQLLTEGVVHLYEHKHKEPAFAIGCMMLRQSFPRFLTNNDFAKIIH